MSKEGQIPCIFDPNKNCDCALKSFSAQYVNYVGKDRGIRGAIQRDGYDRVSAGLIKELLVNPTGSFYTEALDQKLPFSENMRKIRKNIIAKWMSLVRVHYKDHLLEIPCLELRKSLSKTSNT